MHQMTRRQMLTRLAGTTTLAGLAPVLTHGRDVPAPRFPIGACDWSICKMADVDALALARKIGIDGVQVSLGTVENDMHLRRPDVQKTYRQAVRKTGVRIASLAIGELNRVPFKSAPETVEWVSDSIDAAQALNTSIVLLAFFGQGDIKDDAKGQAEVVRRLKDLAPKAEKAGVVLGIESWLSAKEHKALIDQVGSNAVQVYYDVANSHRMGYNIYDEIRWLGKELICECHMKENGALLGQGKIDFAKVRDALEAIGYLDWLIIEGATPSGKSSFESYQANRKFLEQTFRKAC